MIRTAAIATAILLALAVLAVYRGRVAETAKRAEALAAVDPAQRTVPLGDGRVIECSSFPIRSYDGVLLRCTICEEQDWAPRYKPPLLFSCSR